MRADFLGKLDRHGPQVSPIAFTVEAGGCDEGVRGNEEQPVRCLSGPSCETSEEGLRPGLELLRNRVPHRPDSGVYPRARVRTGVGEEARRDLVGFGLLPVAEGVGVVSLDSGDDGATVVL